MTTLPAARDAASKPSFRERLGKRILRTLRVLPEQRTERPDPNSVVQRTQEQHAQYGELTRPTGDVRHVGFAPEPSSAKRSKRRRRGRGRGRGAGRSKQPHTPPAVVQTIFTANGEEDKQSGKQPSKTLPETNENPTEKGKEKEEMKGKEKQIEREDKRNGEPSSSRRPLDLTLLKDNLEGVHDELTELHVACAEERDLSRGGLQSLVEVIAQRLGQIVLEVGRVEGMQWEGLEGQGGRVRRRPR